MKDTDNTNLQTVTHIFPAPVEDEGDTLGGVWYRLELYSDGSILVGRDDEPRFFAPVVYDPATDIYSIDRDNVEWIDDKPANADDILNAADSKKQLRRLIENARAEVAAQDSTENNNK